MTTDLDDHAIDESLPPLSDAPAPNDQGLRNLWDQHDYLLTMVPRLPTFGVPLLDALGLTLDESIIAEEDLSKVGIRPGDTLIEEGAEVTGRLIALLSSVGIDKVMARPNPRVVVAALSPQAIPASYVTTAEVKSAGGQTHRHVVKGSSASIIESITEQLVRADLLVTVGGFGEDGFDLRDVADQLGPHDFTQVAVAPGREQGFALTGDEAKPTVCLPADASAAYVLSKLLVAPMVRHLMGGVDDSMTLLSGYLAQPVKVTPGIVTCVPGHVEYAKVHIPGRITGLDGLYRLCKANALVVLDSADGVADTEAEVWYLPL